MVYDAPNTDQGFIDLFHQAASDNLIDSLSCSWGLAEPFFFEARLRRDRSSLLLLTNVERPYVATVPIATHGRVAR